MLVGVGVGVGVGLWAAGCLCWLLLQGLHREESLRARLFVFVCEGGRGLQVRNASAACVGGRAGVRRWMGAYMRACARVRAFVSGIENACVCVRAGAYGDASKVVQGATGIGSKGEERLGEERREVTGRQSDKRKRQ